MFVWLRNLIVVVLLIGAPVFIYLAFIADDPLVEVEYDIDLGRQSVESINADPEQFPILSEEEHPEAYAYLRELILEVAASDDIQYRDVFDYSTVKIIHDDKTLNAFCTPGGFIYVYTGLIQYLDAEDHLAGVLGHEIAHAERRHSITRLQKEFGKQRLLELLVLTVPATVGDVAAAAALNRLTNLSYSREQEAESDEWSVRYLADTEYACDGTAGFFEKIINEGQDVAIPAFLSDHPDSPSRVRDVKRLAQEMGCSTELGDQSAWRAFQASIPPSAVDSAATAESG